MIYIIVYLICGEAVYILIDHRNKSNPYKYHQVKLTFWEWLIFIVTWPISLLVFLTSD